MNIFEALSYGKGCINEENTSSFLAYLLNPEESHGLKREFLDRFLQLIIPSDKTFNVDNYTVDIKLEDKCIVDDKRRSRSIDITIALRNLANNENAPEYIFAIENKIKLESASSQQFKDEYEGLRSEDKTNANSKIMMVFLTPGLKEKLQAEYDNLKELKEGDKKYHICWNDVVDIIKEILKDEDECNIPPLMDYLKHTLRAFVCYITNILNTEISVFYKKYNKSYSLFLDGASYKIIDKELGQEAVAKRIIVDALKQIDPNFEEKKSDTTRGLGKKLFNLIQKKNIKEITITTSEPSFSENNKL